MGGTKLKTEQTPVVVDSQNTCVSKAFPLFSTPGGGTRTHDQGIMSPGGTLVNPVDLIVFQGCSAESSALDADLRDVVAAWEALSPTPKAAGPPCCDEVLSYLVKSSYQN